jgi:hypothetical protein
MILGRRPTMASAHWMPGWMAAKLQEHSSPLMEMRARIAHVPCVSILPFLNSQEPREHQWMIRRISAVFVTEWRLS